MDDMQTSSDPAENTTPAGDTTDTTTEAVQDTTNVQETTGDTATTEVDERIKRANAEAAERRIQLKNAKAQLAEREKQFEEQAKVLEKIRQGMAQMLGQESDESLSPEEQIKQITEQRDAAQRELQAFQVERAIMGKTPKGVDSTLITTLIKGSGQWEKLNPSSETFAQDVEEIITATVEAYPALQPRNFASSSGQAPKESAAEASKNNTLSRADVSRLAAAGDWEAINKASAAGKINLNS
ncbi:hypothetical protein CIP107573_00477 [Corynebacterium diphtheriae]|nr:hypothetical protein CIP107573_00477 [Corynebacterium diphtheriae]